MSWINGGNPGPRVGKGAFLTSPSFPIADVEAFLVSTGVVALAEIGDKTQLLALVLAARFRRAGPIILGILLATLLNHGAAGWIGAWAGSLLHGAWLRWVLGLSFFAVAIWALIPDTLADDRAARRTAGAFLTTLVSFFLVEIGDKTQIATVALAATYDTLPAVVIGTTLGLMIANVPVVMLGDVAATKLPLRAIRMAAAAIFAVLGFLVLLGVGIG